jgi:hypothetical protein
MIHSSECCETWTTYAPILYQNGELPYPSFNTIASDCSSLRSPNTLSSNNSFNIQLPPRTNSDTDHRPPTTTRKMCIQYETLFDDCQHEVQGDTELCGEALDRGLDANGQHQPCAVPDLRRKTLYADGNCKDCVASDEGWFGESGSIHTHAPTEVPETGTYAAPPEIHVEPEIEEVEEEEEEDDGAEVRSRVSAVNLGSQTGSTTGHPFLGTFATPKGGQWDPHQAYGQAEAASQRAPRAGYVPSQAGRSATGQTPSRAGYAPSQAGRSTSGQTASYAPSRAGRSASGQTTSRVSYTPSKAGRSAAGQTGSRASSTPSKAGRSTSGKSASRAGYAPSKAGRSMAGESSPAMPMPMPPPSQSPGQRPPFAGPYDDAYPMMPEAQSEARSQASSRARSQAPSQYQRSRVPTPGPAEYPTDQQPYAEPEQPEFYDPGAAPSQTGHQGYFQPESQGYPPHQEYPEAPPQDTPDYMGNAFSRNKAASTAPSQARSSGSRQAKGKQREQHRLRHEAELANLNQQAEQARLLHEQEMMRLATELSMQDPGAGGPVWDEDEIRRATELSEMEGATEDWEQLQKGKVESRKTEIEEMARRHREEQAAARARLAQGRSAGSTGRR